MVGIFPYLSVSFIYFATSVRASPPIQAGAGRHLLSHDGGGMCYPGLWNYYTTGHSSRNYWCQQAVPGMYALNDNWPTDFSTPTPCPRGKTTPSNQYQSRYESECTVNCVANQYSLLQRSRVDCSVATTGTCQELHGGEITCAYTFRTCEYCPNGWHKAYQQNSNDRPDVDSIAVSAQASTNVCANPDLEEIQGAESNCEACPNGQTRFWSAASCEDCPAGKFEDLTLKGGLKDKDRATHTTEICTDCGAGYTSAPKSFGYGRDDACNSQAHAVELVNAIPDGGGGLGGVDESSPTACDNDGWALGNNLLYIPIGGVTQTKISFASSGMKCYETDENNELKVPARLDIQSSFHKWIRFGECLDGNEMRMQAVTDGTMAEKAADCASKCFNRDTPFEFSWDGKDDWVIRGFLVRSTDRRCWCETAPSASCIVKVEGDYQRYDFLDLETAMNVDNTSAFNALIFFDESSSEGNLQSSDCEVNEDSGGIYRCFCCPAPPGAYVPQSGHWIRHCPAGTYSPTFGMITCNDCETGKYADSTGTSACTTCPPGRVSEVGSDHVKKCCVEHSRYDDTLGRCGCDENYYRSQMNIQLRDPDICAPCPSGMISSFDSNSILSCHCPDGYGFKNTIQGCEECPAGKKSVATYSPCQDCPAGTYQTSSGKSVCTVCSHGKYSNSVGRAVDCQECTAGKYIDDALCRELISTGEVGRQGPDIDECNDPGGAHCHIPECVDEESDCRECEAGKQSTTAAETCSFCPAGTGNDNAGGTCTSCDIGKYSNHAGTFGICKECPHHYKPSADKDDCEGCSKGTTYDVTQDPVNCVACADGYFQIGDSRLDAFTGNGCFGCNHHKNNEYMDESRQCRTCPRGKYTTLDTGILGVEACEPCKSCKPQEYRTGCEFDVTLNEVSEGRCVSCQECTLDATGNPQTGVGCINQQGHNDAHGKCVKTEFATRTPLCPSHQYDADWNIEKTEQLGLGGFTFSEVFGSDENHTTFQCRLPCDGSNYNGEKDLGYCTGPFSCNIPSCTMQSDDKTEGLTNLQARGCPKEEILDTDSDEEIRAKLSGTCQLCEECQGRGCARECSQLKCESGEIWDFTETRTRNKCKLCHELTDHALCQEGFYEQNLQTTDISGNRPKFQFEECQPKLATNTFTEINNEMVPHRIGYGNCSKCPDESVGKCLDGEYHASCDEEIECVTCHPHGSIELISSTYTTATGVTRPLYCQVSTCADPELTGVDEWGVFCETECGPLECDESEILLPCLLPHPRRCKPAYPVKRAGQIKVDHVPAHANVLERVDSLHLFANFENLLLPLSLTLPEDLHGCVWNAQGITDNDMNPGGIAHSFLSHAQVFESNQLSHGTKFCHPWPDRDMELEYPLLPLQNTVTDTDSAFPRRVLVNTSARVMDYRYTGEGYVVDPFNVPDVTVADAVSFEFTGDLFLDLDVTRAPRASLAVFVPGDRNLASVTWVPQWELSVLARESSADTSLPTLTLTFEIPSVESRMGIDLGLLEKTSAGRHVKGIWYTDNPLFSAGAITAYDGSMTNYPRVFSYSTDVAYVRSTQVSDDFVDTTLPDFVDLGTIDAHALPGDHSVDVEFTSIPEGVVTSIVTGFGLYRACYAVEQDVKCVNEDNSLTQIPVQAGYAIQSLSVYNGMLMITYQRLGGQQPELSYVFWSMIGNTLDHTHATKFEKQEALASAGSSTTLWTLEANSEDVISLKSYSNYEFDGDTYFQTETSINIIEEKRYASQLIELSVISNVLTVDHGRVFVLIPVKSSSGDTGTNDEVVLVMRMYLEDGTLLSSADIPTDTTWSFSKFLSDHVSYTSRVWRDSSRLIIGFLGQVYDVDCSTATVAMTRVPSSHLNNRHFTQVSNGFLAFDTLPVVEATSLTCGSGYTDKELADDIIGSGGISHGDYDRKQCAHTCFIDSNCVGYAFEATSCYHYTTFQNQLEASGMGVKGCERILGSATKELYTMQTRFAHTSSSLRFMGLLRGCSKLSQDGDAAVGYHAFTGNIDNNYNAVEYKNVPYAIRYDGQAVVLDGDLVEDWPDRIFSIDGENVNQIQYFREAYNENGNPLSLDHSDYAEFHILSLTLVIVLDLCDTGTVDLKSEFTLFKSLTHTSSSCDEEYVVIHRHSGKNFVWEPRNVSPEEFDYAEQLRIRLRGNSKIIQMFQTDEMTNFELLALTTPSETYTKTITSEWRQIHRHLSRIAVSTLSATDPVYLHVDGGDKALRSVSLDALQMRPVLTVYGSILTDGALMTVFYMPTKAELDELGLGNVVTGDDVSKWKRLHMTVGVNRGDCRVHLIEVNAEGEEVSGDLGIHSNRLRELGCTTDQRQCHLEVPYSFRDVNSKHYVGLKANLADDCQASNIEAWIAPLTSLWECEGDFFWSEEEKKCQECVTDGNIDQTCTPGEYVPGCDALKKLSNSGCVSCQNSNEKSNLNAWSSDEICVLECIEGTSFLEDGVCKPCSTGTTCHDRELDLVTNRGWKVQKCTKTEDEKCVLCPEIQKSIFSSNEVFVQDPNTICNTTCLEGFYRDLTPPYYCRPCQDLDTLKAELEFIRDTDALYRFRKCSRFKRAEIQTCKVECVTCQSDEYVLEPCTISQNRVCNPCRECDAGEFKSRACSQFENAECQPCRTCGAGETLLEACSETTDTTCQQCPQGTFKILPGNEECTSCQPDCAEGSLELIPCTSTSDRECQTCSFCGAGQFRESGCIGAVCTDCPTGKFMASTEHTNQACDECDMCGEDFYVSAPCTNTTQTSCVSCPLNSGSPANSQDITACQCRPGYTGSDGGECAVCVDGKFKSATGSANCTECNAINCDANFYQDGCGFDSDGCIACPNGTESSAGSTSIEQCLCSLGTKKRSPQAEGESYCVECAIGKYRDNLSDLTCTQCADGHATTILSGSASASDCVCDRGYVWSASSCSACLQGRYKDVVGADPCTDCHDYATSSTASTSWLDCTCLSGYKRYGDFLSPSLPAGNDFDASKDKCCMVCEAGKYLDACTESFAGNCVSCGEGRTTVNSGAHSEELCVCSAGYRHTAPDSVECVKCSPGTYNPHLGMQTCSNCDAGKFGEHEGADEPEDCTVCGLNQYCTEGVGSPEVCPPSTHPYSWTGSTSLSDCCPDCQLGEHYTDLDMNCDCSLCPDGKEAPTRPAYNSGACQDCGAGKFRSQELQGSSGCELCQAGKFSTASGAISESTCQSCPANSVSLAGSSVITACECDRGYTGPDGGTCQACAQGKYKEITGSQHCTGCIAACMCLSSQSHCVCNTNSLFSPEASSDSSECECAAGFSYEQEIGHGDQFFSCISCEEGKSKNAPSKLGCTTCPEGKYSDTRGALTCTECGEGLTSPAGSTSSSDCRIITYEYARGLGDSRMCYTDQIWPSTTSNHALGRDASFDAPTLAHCWNSCVATFGDIIDHIFWDEDTQDCKCQIDCKCLVTGQYDASTSTYIVSRDNTLPDICQCSPGTTGPDGSIPDPSYSGCTECSAGTYKASFGSAACDSCNENQTAPAGSTDISACECQLGYEFFTPPCDCNTGNPFLSACDCPEEYCSPCPLGHHKNITGNSSCFACPAGKISDTTGTINCTSCPEGSEAVIDPEFGATSCDNPCGPGYEGPDDQCTACNPGHFKDGYGSGPCTQCPAGKFSSASGSVDCTSCAANSASADGATECTACTRGQTFKVASVLDTYECTEGGDNKCIEVGDVFRRSNDYRFVGDHTYSHLTNSYNWNIYNTYGMWWLHPNTDSAPYGAICSFNSNSVTAPESDTWLSWHSCMTLLDSCVEQIIF